MISPQRFDFDFDPAYLRAARPFGVRPDNAWLELTEHELRAHFGPWKVLTPLGNVTDAQITGPYAFIKTAGPARLAITDRGLTFATNGRRGVLICFARRVRGIDPLGVIQHPELTVTVRQPERLLVSLQQLAHLK
jgi:hypothetical protein